MEFLDMAFTVLDYFLLWSYTSIYVYIYIYIVIFEGCKTIHFEEHMKMGTIESRLLRRPKIIILRYLQRARVIDTAIDACNRQIRQKHVFQAQKENL